MKEKKPNEIVVLLNYAGKYKALTFLGMFLSAVAMVMGMVPYVCIWLAARDLIAVAPNWTEATEIAQYGWLAFGFAFGGIIVYFGALMSTHLAAFRTAANIRKQGVAHMMKTPLGFFDNNASGLLRNRLDGGANAPALAHVSLSVEPGQTAALVGPSGGGKTTAASLIPRFWDVSSGAVEVGGVDVREIDPHVLMERVAFVFQNDRLFKTSIMENVRAARPNASREEVKAALHEAQCDDIITRLPDGIDTLIGSEGTYLSGGEQQRIALARAILKDAPIIVLDEATAFADPENEALIQKALRTLTKGRTVMMIAHRLSTVVGADRIFVLEEGRLVEEGTHEALASAGGLYERMWNEYNRAVKWKIASGKEGA